MKEFGFFKGMEYDECEESFDDFRGHKNKLSKKQVLEYLRKLEPALAPMVLTHDIFTGERLSSPPGVFYDGEFCFPIDFIHYFEKYDIGIPLEYEEYLITEKGIIPEKGE